MDSTLEHVLHHMLMGVEYNYAWVVTQKLHHMSMGVGLHFVLGAAQNLHFGRLLLRKMLLGGLQALWITVALQCYRCTQPCLAGK